MSWLFFGNRAQSSRLSSFRNLRCEPLEDRRMLSVVAWDGEGDGTNWSDPVNWSSDAFAR